MSHIGRNIEPLFNTANAFSSVSQGTKIFASVKNLTSIAIHSAQIGSEIINTSIITQHVGEINIHAGSVLRTADNKIWKVGQSNNLDEAFMPANMHISESAINFVMKEERLGKKGDNIYDDKGNCIITCPYNDPSHFATVGYGHLIEKAPYNRTKTSHLIWDNGLVPLEAVKLLKLDIAPQELTIKEDITVPLTQNEFDALVIAKYNGGFGETLKNAVNSLDYEPNKIYKAFLARRFSGKPPRELPGLIARRAAEATIFLYNNFVPFIEKLRSQWITKWKAFSF